MKYRYMIAAGLLLGGLTACEKELPNYDSAACQLNFDYGIQVGSSSDVTDAKTFKSYSFVLNGGPDVMRDTIWLDATTMGYLSDKDRPFELQQVTTGNRDAVPGKHYVSFDDAELKAKCYYVPAGKATVRIPVVVLRDASLADEGDVTLKVAFKPNDYFAAGYEAFSTYTLTISDKLSKPTMWDICYLDEYFGEYGPVKHELMIAWTGNAWDDAYLETQFYPYTFSYSGATYWYANDDDYMNYLGQWFQRKLEEENARRLADPAIGDVYREADGTEVQFY